MAEQAQRKPPVAPVGLLPQQEYHGRQVEQRRFLFFFLNHPAPPEISPLPLPAPLPIWKSPRPPTPALSAPPRLPRRPWRRAESCRLPSPLRSRSSSSASRCTSTSGWFASNSLAVHPATPEADLRRRRAPIFEGARLSVSHVLHTGSPRRTGTYTCLADSVACRFGRWQVF